MSVFGWSLPPGVTTLPGEEPIPEEWNKCILCEEPEPPEIMKNDICEHCGVDCEGCSVRIDEDDAYLFYDGDVNVDTYENTKHYLCKKCSSPDTDQGMHIYKHLDNARAVYYSGRDLFVWYGGQTFIIYGPDLDDNHCPKTEEVFSADCIDSQQAMIIMKEFSNGRTNNNQSKQ